MRPVIGIDCAPIGREMLTGTERYALEIVAALLAHPRAGAYDWRLYQQNERTRTRLLDTAGQHATRTNVCFVTLDPARMWTHRRLAQEVAQRSPSLLFVPAHVLPLVRAPRRLPPAVVTLHDVGYRIAPEGHTALQRAYLEWSTRDSLRRAAALLVPSGATANDLVAAYGAERRRLHVVHEAPSPVPPVAVRVAGDTSACARPYALFIGSIQPRKNLVRLAYAYARLHQAGLADFDLVLAGGQGRLSPPILQAVEALHLPGHIRFTGYLDEGERAALLRGARLFCYPSLVEGFGLPVLEAQSVGVPVVTANNSSLPEVAGDGALFVDPTDVDALALAMLRLSRDEALRTHLIAAGHANVQRFSWQKAADETLAVFDGLLHPHGSTPNPD